MADEDEDGLPRAGLHPVERVRVERLRSGEGGRLPFPIRSDVEDAQLTPLVDVDGTPLLARQLEALKAGGVRDVLLLVDNVFRFVQSGTEVSGLMGRIPSRVGYQPTLATELAT